MPNVRLASLLIILSACTANDDTDMDTSVDSEVDTDSEGEVDTEVDTLCADGLLDVGEECDDGNVMNGDGCSADCLYESVDVTDFPTASIVLGQADALSGSPNQDGDVGAGTMRFPIGKVAIVDDVLYVTDGGNGRILIFDPVPSGIGVAGTNVIGRPSLTDDSGTGSAGGVISGFARDLCTDGLILGHSNTTGHTATLYDPPPTADALPSVVLGTFDQSGTSSTLFDEPFGCGLGGGAMAVADTRNHRILLFDAIPTSDQTAPDLILGQPDATSNDVNRGGDPSANSLNGPFSVWTDGNRLLVSDSVNNRVLLWDEWPTSADTAPDSVLGQPDFTSNAAGVGPMGMTEPGSPFVFGQQVFVPDIRNHRVLVWDEWPSTGTPPDHVIGQSNFTNVASNDDNQDGVADTPTARTLARPTGVFVQDGQVWVADSFNHRVVGFSF